MPSKGTQHMPEGDTSGSRGGSGGGPATLGDVEPDGEQQTFDQLTEAQQEQINNVDVDTMGNEENAQSVKEALSEQQASGESTLTDAQLERMEVRGTAGDGPDTDVMYQVSSDNNVEAGEAQTIGVHENGVDSGEARRAVTRAKVTANGAKDANNDAVNTARSAFEDDGVAGVQESGIDPDQRRMEVSNESMMTQDFEGNVDAANEFFESTHDSDYEMFPGRSDSGREKVSASEAYVAAADGLQQDDHLMGTNYFTNEEGAKFAKQVGETEGMSEESQKVTAYLHDASEHVDGVESQWDDSDFADVEYSADEVNSALSKSLSSGGGVDERFWPSNRPEVFGE